MSAEWENKRGEKSSVLGLALVLVSLALVFEVAWLAWQAWS